MKTGLGIGIPNNSTTATGGGSTPLLDAYPGAAAAYSLRELSTAWAGQDVILARRSSDDAELGFTASEITDGTLTSWAGVGNAFVKTWYDQSGNGRDATQTTTDNQPTIVSSGTLVTENGQPAIDFDGSNDVLPLPSMGITGSTNRSLFTVTNITGLSGAISLGDGGGNGQRWTFRGIDSAARIEIQGSGYSSSLSAVGQSLAGIIFSGATLGDHLIFVNESTEQASGANAVNTIDSGNKLGAYLTTEANGTIQEVILWPTDQTNNRAEISTAINSHYSIY